MARISVSHVSLDFPVYSLNSRSLKKQLVRLGTGGRLMRNENDRIVVKALDDVGFELRDGDRLALVGHNGAGKTTLLRTLAGIYEPTAGRIESEGTISSLLDISHTSDPDGTGYENIRVRGLMMGLRPRDLDKLIREVEAFTELGDYLAMPIRTYSSGMMMRLFFALATAVNPDILLMDEWLSAGDATFMEKAQQRLDDLIGRTKILVLASHSENLIREVCNCAILLDCGRLVLEDDVSAVFDRYRRSPPRQAAE